jgi:hypothetical protein
LAGKDEGGNPSQEKPGQEGEATRISWQSPYVLDHGLSELIPKPIANEMAATFRASMACKPRYFNQFAP